MRKTMKIMALLSVVLVLALVIPVLSGCAKPQAPAELKGDVIVGLTGPLTGPAAGSGTPAAEVFADLAYYFNSKGGAAGHQFKVITADDQFNPDVVVTNWKKFKDVDKAHMAFTMAGTALVGPLARESKFVTAGSPDPMVMFQPPIEESYFFSYSPVFYSFYTTGLKWYKENVWKGSKPPVIGTFLYEASSGKQADKGIKVGLQNIGWPQPVVTAWTPATLKEATSQVLEFKNANVDLLICWQIDGPAIALLKEMDRQGYKPAIFAPWMFVSPATLKATPGLADGMTYFTVGASWSETNIEGIKILHELNAQLHPSVTDRPVTYTQTACGAVLFEGLKIATEKYGYEGLTGPNIKAALESIKDYSFYGANDKVTVTPTNHQIVQAMRMGARKGDTATPTTDYIKFIPLSAQEMTLDYWK